MFIVKIKMNNATFGDVPGHEIARILRKLADNVSDWGGEYKFNGILFDANGNRVGIARGV